MIEQHLRQNDLDASKWIEETLLSISSTVPVPPELAETFGAAANSIPLPATKAKPLRLLMRSTLVLLLLGALAAALQIAGRGLPRRYARLTPLTQVNAAWASAEGYVLEFDVFDRDISGGDEHARAKPNYERFEKAAYAWASREGLSYAKVEPDGSCLMINDPGFVLWNTSAGTMTSQCRSSGAQISLRVDDLELVNELCETLSGLPGVSQPVIEPRTVYFCLGGLNLTVDKARVLINGVSHEFPEDFTEWEAGDLMVLIKYGREHPVAFRAFPDKLLAGPDGSRSFSFGDVIRTELDSNGNLIIRDLLEHWDIPPESHVQLHQGVAGGWGFALPPGVEEASIDPVAELARRIDPLPADLERLRYTVHTYYWLIPLERILSQGGRSITAEEAEAAAGLAGEMQTALNAWVNKHPEVRRSLVFGDRVIGYPIEAGPNIVCFTASVSTNDQDEADRVQQALAGVKGAPEAVVTRFDRDAP